MPKVLRRQRLSSQQVSLNPDAHTIFFPPLLEVLLQMFRSGVGQLALDYLWQTNAEGDFIVMQVSVL